MASRSLAEWRTSAHAAFDEIEHAHRALGGLGPGRRVLTEQINHAYVVILVARFQGFARALHTEAAHAMAAGTPGHDLRQMFWTSLTRDRSLDRYNAQPNSLSRDFERFGIDLWGGVDLVQRGNAQRRAALWRLIEWRNAIAHHDIETRLTRGTLAPRTITMAACRRWRSVLNLLAKSLDIAVADGCEAAGRPRPW